MNDQATDLRNLVLETVQTERPVSGAGLPCPRLIVLSGGKGGVGVTTLAVNLAVGLGEQGCRVILVDADLYRADVAVLCGLHEKHSVADVIAARRDIHEVLERGPGGIQVVPGLWAPGMLAEYHEVAQQRLLQQFHSLGKHADVIVLDTGSGANRVVQRFWEAADQVLLVTTPDSVSVMDSYATLKTMQSPRLRLPVQIVVNRCSDQELALDVHLRMNRACEHFLGISTVCAGFIPDDAQVTEATYQRRPFVHLQGVAATAMTTMAAALAETTERTISRAA